MYIFQKQTTRRTIVSSLLIFLLTLAIGASSLGVTAWIGAERQFADIDQDYTTIAIPLGANMDRLTGPGRTTSIGMDSKITPDGSTYIGPRDSKAIVEKSGAYLGEDRRILLSAHIRGMTPLSSGKLDELDYDQTIDSFCYNICVAVVKCLGTTPRDDIPYSKYYRADLEILDLVSSLEVYQSALPEGHISQYSTDICDQNGRPLFEEGKTYLIRGLYWDVEIVNLGDDNRFKATDTLLPQIQVDQSLPSVLGTQHFMLSQGTDPETGETYYYAHEGVWPVATEITGDWQDFLETEEGRVWKEEIIPFAEANQNSAPVILTDDLGSMYNFNTGTASILEGRMFTQEEYDQGEKVCIISAAYAQLNDLQLGDTLDMVFYNSGYSSEVYAANYLGERGVELQRMPMTPKTHMDIRQDYTIIGIYTAPEWGPGVHDFNADTIFIPKASIPNADQYATGTLVPMLHSVILKNGSVDEVEAFLAEEKKAGAYIYFDQGYSELEASLQALLENARRMLTIGLPVFFLATLVFLLLDGRRRGNVARSLRLLGVKRGKVWLEAWGAVLTMALVAIFLGNLLGALFFRKVTEELLSAALTLEPVHVLLCAGAQFVVVAVLSAVWMGAVSGRDLMNRK